MVDGDGFAPSKRCAADLQSAGFVYFPTHQCGHRRQKGKSRSGYSQSTRYMKTTCNGTQVVRRSVEEENSVRSRAEVPTYKTSSVPHA